MPRDYLKEAEDRAREKLVGANATPEEIKEKVAPVKLVADVHVKVAFLYGKHRYKVLYGGRGGGKSYAIADALLRMGAAEPLRILCAREVMKSLKQSVHQLLADRIVALGLESRYRVMETEIRGVNGTLFLYTGLSDHTVTSIKSFEDIDICWVEEAQATSDFSWRILRPTIRKAGSEIWVSFNPDFETDAVWKIFMVNRPAGTVAVELNYYDNPYLTAELEAERQDCLKSEPQEYDNIWLGKCRSSVAGAIYASEVNEMISGRRFLPLPYDPRLPVHTIWDLGWNDKMAVIMAQKPHPSALNVINYLEVHHKTYADVVGLMKDTGYRVWGTDWLPHDAVNSHPTSGSNAFKTLRSLGRRRVRTMDKTGPEERIRAARLMFPRLWMDNSVQTIGHEEYLGAGRLMECLRRYRRHIPKSADLGGEEATPLHDVYSHGADAFGAMGEIVNQIRNENEGHQGPAIPAYHNPDPGMGMLG